MRSAIGLSAVVLFVALVPLPATCPSAPADSSELDEALAVLTDYSIEELELALMIKVTQKYSGAAVVSAESEPVFLGTIGSELDSDSIFNEIGRYGSEISRTSIWNTIGTYGGTISRYSAFNPITNSPPSIVKDGRVIGRLTVNPMVAGRVSPYLLRHCFVG